MDPLGYGYLGQLLTIDSLYWPVGILWISSWFSAYVPVAYIPS